MNRIFKFVLPGALLLLVCLIACNKDNPASGLFSNGGATDGYTSSSELSIASAKNYFQSKKKESSSRDTTTSISIVDIMQNLELEWNLADTILYQNITPVIVVPIKSAITPFHHSTMIFFLNEQNVIESRLFTVVTDSTYTPSSNFSQNFNGFVAQINWSGDLVHSYRIDNGVITGSVATQADSRNEKPICPPGSVLVIYVDDYTRYYDCITISSGGGGGGGTGGGNPFNPDPFGLGGGSGNGNNDNNNNGGGGSGANDYLTNFFDPNDFEGLAKKSALLVNAFKSKYILYNSSQILLNQLIDECGLENNEEDLYGELLEILNGPPQPCVQTVINNDRILFFQQTYGLAVTLAQLQSINNAGLLVNSNTFINFFVSKNLNAAQVTWLIQNMQTIITYGLNFIGAQDINILSENPDYFALYISALANTPNATQEQKEQGLRFVFDAPQSPNPINNLPQKLNCFNTQNNQGGTHKITLYADQPIANSDDCSSLAKRGGHAFLGIAQQLNGESKSLNIGLYPQSLLKAIGYSGGVFNNDENHPYDVSITWDVTPAQFNTLISNLQQFSIPPDYNVAAYNCSDFALSAIQGIGISFDSPKVPQYIPFPPGTFTVIYAKCSGQLGQDMRAYTPPGGGVTKNTSGGNSPLTQSYQ